MHWLRMFACIWIKYIWVHWSQRHWLEPPLHGHGANVPPASVQPSGGLLDGVTLSLRRAGVTVVQKDFTQIQHWRHTSAVFLYVPLQILQINQNKKFIFALLATATTGLCSLCVLSLCFRIDSISFCALNEFGKCLLIVQMEHSQSAKLQ